MDTLAIDKAKDNANKKGFTLIELVIVIILIGILAATALPKFANLTTQARDASNEGVAGGLGSAVGIAHAAWVANGQVSPITLDSTVVTVNANGWPDGGANSISSVTPTQCANIWTLVLNNPPAVQVGGTCPVSNPNCYIASSSGSVCTFGYGPNPTVITITYDISAGTTGFTSQ